MNYKQCHICGKQHSEFKTNDVLNVNSCYIELGGFRITFDVGTVLCEDCAKRLLAQLKIRISEILNVELPEHEAKNLEYILDLADAHALNITLAAKLKDAFRQCECEKRALEYKLALKDRKIKLLENKVERMKEEYFSVVSLK